ncbi:MAG: hypothetical protein EZS28_026497 [Streblomastix strix]|uniref:Uncharacterized protein n=1 Tax=Streblomastix strix TaxID=222440 RepID=A0A5J4V5V9_9EUKA|nr:MAG: hypothetical protein EZS28_026497 [Streblomastix strix]
MVAVSCWTWTVHDSFMIYQEELDIDLDENKGDYCYICNDDDKKEVRLGGGGIDGFNQGNDLEGRTGGGISE